MVIQHVSTGFGRLALLILLASAAAVYCYPKIKSFPVEPTHKNSNGGSRHGNGNRTVSAHRCEFSLQSIPGFNPLVKTDKKGKSCRGDILIPFCYGMCKTRESGTHIFPYREQEGYVCGIIGDEYENVTLTDCDEGADPSIRHVIVSKSKSCGCRKLPVTL